MTWIAAIAVAVVAAGLEAWLSGPRPFDVLRSFRQPRWALPVWGWLMIGAAFYIIMIISLALTLEAGPQGYLAAGLIVLVLLTDGYWNYLLFRLRRFDFAFYYLTPYAILVAAAAAASAGVNAYAGLAITAYLLFLPYDFAWARALMTLNSEPSQRTR